MHYNHYKEIWCTAFDCMQTEGEPPKPTGMAAIEMRTGQQLRFSQNDLQTLSVPPFSTDKETLVVDYDGTLEMACFFALGWPMPKCHLSLFAEFRAATNGRNLLGDLDYSMQSALLYYGLPISVGNQSGVGSALGEAQAVVRLWQKMAPALNPPALYRGRYLQAVAVMERNGIPIDIETYCKIMAKWDGLLNTLITETDKTFRFFEGTTFKESRFEEWTKTQNIPWPRLASGKLVLDIETFRDMARVWPAVAPLHQLRSTLSQARHLKLTIGEDGRNRSPLAPYASKTGRNQPSTNKFIFGCPAWLRSLIRPKTGTALAYIDWSAQEFGIAAALSGDTNMHAAYNSGDPYLFFGKKCGVIPTDGTKESHAAMRDKLKTVILATQYGMGAKSLALRLGTSEQEAQRLLELHRKVFRRYWTWIDAVDSYARDNGHLKTVYGWPLFVQKTTKERTIKNFLLQATGAEIMRLFCCMAVERGIKICAPVHDAVLIESSQDAIIDQVKLTQDLMCQAGSVTLNGFKLRSEVKIIHAPDRYTDSRGKDMWDTVNRIILNAA